MNKFQLLNDGLIVNKISKTYGNKKVVRDISLSIKRGEIVGLLGPNGAGKTTTIGIMTGLVNLTSGSIEVMGHDVIKNYKESRKLIGLSPQELNFDVFFPIRDVLALNAGYYGISNKKSYERADIMLEQFGLTDKAKSTARELSGGMKRRVQIAKALVHNPEILILDNRYRLHNRYRYCNNNDYLSFQFLPLALFFLTLSQLRKVPNLLHLLLS